MKKYEIAISENGIVLKCKLVSEEEFKQLSKQSQLNLANEEKAKRDLKLKVANLEEQVEILKNEIKLLKGE